jgi:hypothetical protein
MSRSIPRYQARAFHDDFPSPSSKPESKAPGREREKTTAGVAEQTAVNLVGPADDAGAASSRILLSSVA